MTNRKTQTEFIMKNDDDMESKYILKYRSDSDTYNMRLCETKEEALHAQEKYTEQIPHSSGMFSISKIPKKYNDDENILMFEYFEFRPKVNDDRKIYRIGKFVPGNRLLGERASGSEALGLREYRICSMLGDGFHCELTRGGGQFVSKCIDMLLFGIDNDAMAEFKFHAINQLKERVAYEGFGKVWESLPEGAENVES